MTPTEELDSLYVDIGNIGAEITDTKLKAYLGTVQQFVADTRKMFDFL